MNSASLSRQILQSKFSEIALVLVPGVTEGVLLGSIVTVATDGTFLGICSNVGEF